LVSKVIRNLDFPTLTLINKEVVLLTGERHEFDEEDERRIKSLADEVAGTYNEEEFEEALVRKTSLLVYRIASGQHFHEGNKRTALVAASAFLRMNGRSLDMKDQTLVTAVDRAGVATATLNELEKTIRKLIKDE